MKSSIPEHDENNEYAKGDIVFAEMNCTLYFFKSVDEPNLKESLFNKDFWKPMGDIS